MLHMAFAIGHIRACLLNRAAALSAPYCLLLFVAACSGQQQGVFQGYAEGEFLYLSSSQSGRLDRLDVVRGL